MHRHARRADRRDQAEILWPQPRTGRQHGVTRCDIDAGLADPRTALRHFIDRDATFTGRAGFLHDDRIRTCRNRAL